MEMNNKNVFKLSGFLSEFPIVEVIQFLGMTRKKGRLRIALEEEDKDLRLYFKDGELVHAETDDIKGFQAFYLISKLETGYFNFQPDEEAPVQTIDCPLSVLLLNSQKRLDELHHLQSQLPNEDAVLFIVKDVHKVPPLNTLEWQIISMINGRRTIARVCEKAGDELDAKNTILNLLSKGLISTFSEDTVWKTLVPSLKPSEELKTDRPYPPLLRTNLLLKSIDGKLSLTDLMSSLNMKENELLEDIRLLYDTQWITFPYRQEKVFARLKNEL
jgi:hypothetical protein